MGQSAPVVPFTQREGIRGEDKYAATTFRRIELQDDDLSILFAIFIKIKDKNRHPKVVDPASISKYFGVKNSDFVVKLFAAVDFDGNDSIDFKEFTLGLWNFLSLSSDFLPALVFHLYDPLKFNLLDMKELKDMLEAIHGVKLSSFTLALNSIMKEALLSNTEGGLNVEKFGIMCIDTPFIIKPILTLQQQLRKRIVGAAYWKKLEFRRSASIKGNLRDVNYVYIVNEETEIWRSKDFELGIGRPYELTESEIAMQKVTQQLKEEKVALQEQQLQDRHLREQREMEEVRQREETDEAKQVEELRELVAASKEQQLAEENKVKQAKMMSNNEGREVEFKKGVVGGFEDFAESMFNTAEGKLVGPEVQVEAAAVLEFPGGENFIFGVVADNKNKEDTLVLINRDLSRRRVKGRDLARINSNFKFVGYSKLSVKTLPGQIRVRPNLPLLELCNTTSLVPKLPSDGVYVRGQWNEALRGLVIKEAKTGDLNYLDDLAAQRQAKAEEEAKRLEDESKNETQETRVNNRLSILMTKEKEKNNSRKSMIAGQTTSLQQRKTTIVSSGSGSALAGGGGSLAGGGGASASASASGGGVSASASTSAIVSASGAGGGGGGGGEGESGGSGGAAVTRKTINSGGSKRSTINEGGGNRSTINSGSKRSTINRGSKRSTINEGGGGARATAAAAAAVAAGGKLAPLKLAGGRELNM